MNSSNPVYNADVNNLDLGNGDIIDVGSTSFRGLHGGVLLYLPMRVARALNLTPATDEKLVLVVDSTVGLIVLRNPELVSRILPSVLDLRKKASAIQSVKA